MREVNNNSIKTKKKGNQLYCHALGLWSFANWQDLATMRCSSFPTFRSPIPNSPLRPFLYIFVCVCVLINAIAISIQSAAPIATARKRTVFNVHLLFCGNCKCNCCHKSQTERGQGEQRVSSSAAAACRNVKCQAIFLKRQILFDIIVQLPYRAIWDAVAVAARSC